MKKKVTIKIYQQDFMPGFAAYLGGSLSTQSHAAISLNVGAIAAMVVKKDIKPTDIPAFVVESLFHEVIHVLEEFAQIKFSEKRVEALTQKYIQEYSKRAPKGRKSRSTAAK